MLDGQLKPLASPAANIKAYHLTLRSGAEIDLAINHRTHRVTVTGSGPAMQSMHQLIRVLDASSNAGSEEDSTRLIPLKTTRPADVQRTIEAIRLASGAQEARQEPAAKTTAPAQAKPQPDSKATAQAQLPTVPGQAIPGKGPAGKAPAEEGAGLVGPVQVELIDGMDALVIRGRRRDVEQVREIIKRIEELSIETEPAIEVRHLSNVDSIALGNLLNQIYPQVFALRQGNVSITALVRPNALLLIGRKEAVQKVVELIERLDVAMPAEADVQVFRLKHAAAATAQTILQGMFPDRTTMPGATQTTSGLAPQVQISADVRANSLIVQASPREMEMIRALVERIDTPESETVNELRLFRLVHTLAIDMADLLREAMQAQPAAGQAARPTTPMAAAAARNVPAAATTGTGQRASMLQFISVDPQGQRQLTSGILSEVQITADPTANSLVVSAPTQSMGLIQALIQQLDQPPAMRGNQSLHHGKRRRHGAGPVARRSVRPDGGRPAGHANRGAGGRNLARAAPHRVGTAY